jgi:chromosome segregation ATPase
MTVLRRVLGIFLLTMALSGVVLSQTGSTVVSRPGNAGATEELLREVRLARLAVQDLKRQLVQLEALAIQIRLQQDTIAASEARVDAIRSEAQSTEEPINQLRDRINKLEAPGSSPDEDEQQRTLGELLDAKKEIERQQQRLDFLRAQDVQFTAQLQNDKARLSELLSRLDALSVGAGDTHVQNISNDLSRSPNN